MISLLVNVTPTCVERILSGKKTSLLTLSDPNMKPPFRIYLYDPSSKAVVAEFFCTCVNKWRMCRGIPDHLMKKACLKPEEIVFFRGDNECLYELYIDRLFRYGKSIPIIEFGLDTPPKNMIKVETKNFSEGFSDYKYSKREISCGTCIHKFVCEKDNKDKKGCAYYDGKYNYLELSAHVGDIVFCEIMKKTKDGKISERHIKSVLKNHLIAYGEDGEPKVLYKVIGIKEPLKWVSHNPLYPDPRSSEPFDYEDFLCSSRRVRSIIKKVKKN